MTYSGVVTKLCPTLHGFIADIFADGRDMSAVLDVMWWAQLLGGGVVAFIEEPVNALRTRALVFSSSR